MRSHLMNLLHHKLMDRILVSQTPAITAAIKIYFIVTVARRCPSQK
jgi:hypothetical protein